MKGGAFQLRTRTEGRFNPDAPTKAELDIMQEKAEALGRAGSKVDEGLRSLRALEERIKVLEKKGNNTPEVNALITEFNQVREEALLHLHHLIIHREAIGFRRHTNVKRMYKIPVKKGVLSDDDVREDHYP